MANIYFNSDFKVCSMVNAEYLYIDNVDDFLKDCGEDYIYDNVDEKGVYQWNDYDDVWELANLAVKEKIKSLVKEVNSLRQETPHQNNNNSIGWNILVTLNTGDVIQTNSVPLSIKEISEAVDILLRPSFFGKTIKEFKIVAV